MIACKLCGREMKGLTLHLIKLHKLTPTLYLQQFPGSKLFSDEVLSGANFGGRAMKGRTRENKPMSDETKKKISIARSNYTGWTHSAETIEKMRATSQKSNVKNARRDAIIKRYQDDPSLRKNLSDKVKARIATSGFHLKRGKSTSLEKAISELLKTNNIQFKREHRSANVILNTYRFFDFYLPTLKAIIEIDGEFWHRQELRVQIDKLKHEDAHSQGCTFLRLSDVYDKDLLKQPDKLLELIVNSQAHEAHTKHVIDKRALHIFQHGFTLSKNETSPMSLEERSKLISEKSKASWAKKKAEGYTVSAETREKISKTRSGKTFGPRVKPYVMTKKTGAA